MGERVVTETAEVEDGGAKVGLVEVVVQLESVERKCSVQSITGQTLIVFT